MADGKGNVDIRDVYNLVDGTRKELKADIGVVNNRINDLVEERGELSERVATVETDIKHLNRRDWFWGGTSGLGFLIASVLSYFGLKN